MTTTAAVLVPVQPEPGRFGGGDTTSTVVLTGSRTAGGAPTGPLLHWSDTRFGSSFGFPLHRHEGLETLTVVLDGRTQHFDTTTRRWYDLRAGDVQVMRAGSGLSHSERVVDAARVFQIMVDPGPPGHVAPPSYDDHKAEIFSPVEISSGVTITQVVGDGGPVRSRRDGLVVQRIGLRAGATWHMGSTEGRSCLVQVLSGAVDAAGLPVAADGVVDLSGRSESLLTARESTELFLLAAPVSAS